MRSESLSNSYGRHEAASPSIPLLMPVPANKLLSAMRYEFGGHLEKSDERSKDESPKVA